MMRVHSPSIAALAICSALFLACSDDTSAEPDAGELEPGDGDGDGDGDAAADAGTEDGGDAGDDLAALSETVYDPDAVLQVELTVDEGDWELIRDQGRELNDVFAGCEDPEFAYTEVVASAVIDGEEIADIGLRKKGFLGSLSSLRPSLRLDFDEVDPMQRFRGLKGMTFNNNRQDMALVRQCLAYYVFSAAGVPTPRCTFAHITLNGDDLGIYTNIEQVGKPLLRRYFESDDGDLYEGNAGSDFRSDKLEFFERKTNEMEEGYASLEPLSKALASPDPAKLADVEELLDVDGFMRFWAIESLISHWDGYTGDLNNFFVYVDPTTSKVSFMPWGTDGSFDRDHGFLPEIGRPVSLFAMARLPARLYGWQASRAQYRDVMQEMLDGPWNEDELNAEIDRMAALIEDADPAALDELRDFIDTRRAEVQAELDTEAPEWPFPERGVFGCFDRSNAISGTFDTVWGDSLDLATPGEGNTLMANIPGVGESFADMLGSAAYFNDGGSLRGPTIRVMTFLEDGTVLIAQVSIGPQPLVPGAYPFHGLETSGLVLRAMSMTDFEVVGFLGEGEIVFEEASEEDGAPIRGHFSGRLTPIDF